MHALPIVLQQMREIRNRTIAKLVRLEEAIKALEAMVNEGDNGQGLKLRKQQPAVSLQRAVVPKKRRSRV
jgi:hypothetical protein